MVFYSRGFSAAFYEKGDGDALIERKKEKIRMSAYAPF